MPGNYRKRLERLEHKMAEIAKAKLQGKCNCRKFTWAGTAQYFADEMNQICHAHGFRSLGKIQLAHIRIVGANLIEDKSVGLHEVVAEYKRRLAHHREQMLKKIEQEDDSPEL